MMDIYLLTFIPGVLKTGYAKKTHSSTQVAVSLVVPSSISLSPNLK